jgi:hypothetical protein
LIKGNSIINKFDFQKIELNANRNNGKWFDNIKSKTR